MRVVVLGGGYAGLTLARRLEGLLPDEVDLTVVDDTGTHLVRHEVHRVVRRPNLGDVLTVPLVDVLDRAEVVTARVEAIDRGERRVALDDQPDLTYDYAAVCLGATPAFYDLPGVENHATPLTEISHAEQVRSDFLDVLEGGGRVVVGGAGLSGVQVAGELTALAREQVDGTGAGAGGGSDEGAGSAGCESSSATATSPDASRAERAAAALVSADVEVVLVERLESIAPGFPRAFQAAIRDQLEGRGVDVWTGTELTEATADAVQLDGEQLAFDQFVWTGGITGPAALGGERPSVRGDLRLDARTFALGDAATIVDANGEAVPASAATAVREARTVATSIARLVDHEEKAADGEFDPRVDPYRFDVPGWTVSVGDGAVARIGPTVLTGTAARAAKATVGAGHLGSAGAIRRAVDLVEAELELG